MILASLASFGFLNTSIAEINPHNQPALHTLEHCRLHLRNHIGYLEHNTCQLNHMNKLLRRQILDTVFILSMQINETNLHVIFYQSHR